MRPIFFLNLRSTVPFSCGVSVESEISYPGWGHDVVGVGPHKSGDVADVKDGRPGTSSCEGPGEKPEVLGDIDHRPTARGRPTQEGLVCWGHGHGAAPSTCLNGVSLAGIVVSQDLEDVSAGSRVLGQVSAVDAVTLCQVRICNKRNSDIFWYNIFKHRCGWALG